MTRILAAAALSLLAGTVFADWQLDNAASRLAFVSVKAGDVGEVHRFTALEGSVTEAGEARVTIRLASVDTLIPIRDERMRELLFKTATYPSAEVTTRLDPGLLAGIGATPVALSAELMLSMTGVELPVTATLLAVRTSDDSVIVATAAPIIVNAAALQLADGIEALREVAGLPSISKAVPVTFVLTFVRSPTGP
jgi:hypothetical protein